jgi:alpha-D-ribose 1-methylphosphonate 5-triphosphate synthase subunit PhnH
MTSIETGFDLVFDSQKVFRRLLDAFSRPGEISELPNIPCNGLPEGSNPFVFAVLKTLLDTSVTFAVSGDEEDGLSEYIRINTGAAASDISDAGFAVFGGNRCPEDFSKLSPGTLEFPETGATAIISVGSISLRRQSEADIHLTFAGPGVKATNHLFVAVFDPAYVEQAAVLNSNYPTGIDMILVDATGIVIGIPRTTIVEVL